MKEGTSHPPNKRERGSASNPVAYLFLWMKPETGEIWGKEFCDSLSPRRPAGLPEGYAPELAGRFPGSSQEAMVSAYPAEWGRIPGLTYLNAIPWVHEVQAAAACTEPLRVCGACIHGDPKRRRFSDGPVICAECGCDDRDLLTGILGSLLRVECAPDIVRVDLGSVQPEQMAALVRLGARSKTSIYTYPDRAPQTCVRWSGIAARSRTCDPRHKPRSGGRCRPLSSAPRASWPSSMRRSGGPRWCAAGGSCRARGPRAHRA